MSAVKDEVTTTVTAETECLKAREYPKVVVIGSPSKGERWYSVSHSKIYVTVYYAYAR